MHLYICISCYAVALYIAVLRHIATSMHISSSALFSLFCGVYGSLQHTICNHITLWSADNWQDRQTIRSNIDLLSAYQNTWSSYHPQMIRRHLLSWSALSYQLPWQYIMLIWSAGNRHHTRSYSNVFILPICSISACNRFKVYFLGLMLYRWIWALSDAC